VTEKRESEADYQRGRGLLLAVLILYAVISRVYLVLRYSGLNVMGDGAYFVRAAESVISSGSIAGPITYQGGFGHPTFLAFLSEVTGLAPITLQLYVAPILGIIPLFIAYALFRRLLGRTRSAFVALVVLALLPDFLIVTSRSTHEILTISLFVVELVVLFEIMFNPERKRGKLRWTALWWVVFLGLLSLNIVFAYVIMITSVTLVVLVDLGLRRLNLESLLARRTWWSFVATSVALTFFYAWYIYPPSAPGLVNLHVNLLFVTEILTPDQIAGYEFVQSTWSSIWVYLGLTFSLWAVLAVAATEWLREIRLFALRKTRKNPETLFMVGAFGVLGFALGASIAADFVTRLGNAQYRVLPLVLMISVPLAVFALRRHGLLASRLARNRLVAAIIIVGIVLLSTTNLVKATTDPSVSRYWSFYSVDELAGVNWVERHLQGQTVWADVDSRILRLSWQSSSGDNLYAVAYVFGVQQLRSSNYCYLFDSSLIEERLSEYGATLRLPSGANLVYQNGQTRIWGVCVT